MSARHNRKSAILSKTYFIPPFYFSEVPYVDEMQESFHQRISIDENFSQRYAVIEIDLTSVKMLVSLRVDTKNRNVVTTTLLQEGVGNEVSVI